MKTNDFSAPRRMSKSAFVIFLVNNLWLYAKYFLFIVILELFNSEKKLSFIEAALDFFGCFGNLSDLGSSHCFYQLLFQKVLCGEWKSDFHSRFGT